MLGDTESATLSVSRDLGEVVDTAQAFLEDIKASLGDLQSDGQDSVGGKLEHQCTLVTSFLTELRESARLQRDAAERMLATSHKVAAAAASVSQIATASRVLCLNTMIEAGRLGDAGQPMIVIADQMRSLSEQIGKSNKEIGASIETLLPTLEDVGASSSRVEERANAFSGEFEVQATEVGQIADRLRQIAQTALDGGDRKMDTILGCSRSAITSLQTQDLVSQRLRRMLQLLDRSGAAPSDEAPTRHGAGETPPGTNPQPDAARPHAEPDVYLSDSLANADERALDEGEMMMF
ncbi:MAG: methyl-accepting chemotaxis protein [Planctomycetes bacterium]|nr:methyl-accepting chemotaxis protein [Planctomycetota bacterium]